MNRRNLISLAGGAMALMAIPALAANRSVFSSNS
jgi:hypothetical protein